MKRRRNFIIALATAVCAGMGTTVFAQQPESGSGAQALANAKITLEQARAIALKAAPGDVIEEEFEHERGAWRYSFDIREGERIHEIGVDPQTGKIVEDSWEGTSDED